MAKTYLHINTVLFDFLIKFFISCNDENKY